MRHRRRFHRVLHFTCDTKRLRGEIFDDEIGIVSRTAIRARGGHLYKLIEPKRQCDECNQHSDWQQGEGTGIHDFLIILESAVQDKKSKH